MKSPLLFAALLAAFLPVAAQDPAGVSGGLILQIGGDQLDKAAQQSQTGRFVIHIVDSDPAKLDYDFLREHGRYGLVWAEHRPDLSRLPYAEHVVNGIVITRDLGVSATELARVLTPGGGLEIHGSNLTEAELAAAGFENVAVRESMMAATRSWPEEMDAWTHPRHGSDGNAVSKDTSVGPPERVRWVAAATWEVEGLVTSGGRNFYGGILARNSFNGLRLWHRDLAKAGDRNVADFKLPRLPKEGARPVAHDDYLFAVMGGDVVALDAATGELKVTYEGVESPRTLLNFENYVITAGAKGVHAFNATNGEQIWSVEAKEPHNVVAGNGLVSFIHGQPKRGEKSEAVMIDLATGEEQWRKSDFPFLDQTKRTVLYGDHIAFEVSTFNDHDKGNGIYVVKSQTGEFAWEKTFPPAMSHKRQARALFLEDAMWILHGARINTDDPENRSYQKAGVSALELDSGEVMVTHAAGAAHCFPPVATPNWMFAGELDLTDLRSGDVVANRITKANCSSENGWVPANGLVYTTPKHCTCWPMLRGYVAMAPAMKEDNPALKPIDEIEFALQSGPAQLPDATQPKPGEWPFYRRDKWRSGSNPTDGPKNLEIAWRTQLIPDLEVASLAAPPAGPIVHDWRENPYVKGPLTPPIIANGVAYLARPDAHEVIAVKADGSGEIVWRRTVNGRVDTPPSYFEGLVLFGTHSGSVYGLRADNGEQVWQLTAAPTDDRIVAYGQVESPWPVHGSIL
ncbi:MAG: PQQ-binding-like beta-propeller repeat protein, partial [Verrucomicrobiota bacterium]